MSAQVPLLLCMQFMPPPTQCEHYGLGITAAAVGQRYFCHRWTAHWSFEVV